MEKKEEGNKREPQVLFGGKFEKEEEEVESEKEEEESEENVEVEEEDEEESETEEDESEAEEEETWSDFDTRHDDLNHRDMMARKNLELAKKRKAKEDKNEEETRRVREASGEEDEDGANQSDDEDVEARGAGHFESVGVETSGASHSESEASGEMSCSICGLDDHCGVCPWSHRACKEPGCKGFCFLLNSNGKRFLKCQNDLCIGFQLLEKVIADGACTSSPIMQGKSTKCFGCDEDGHWLENCPWNSSPCQKCYGVRRALLTSRTEKTYGQKFLKCRQCEGFQWLKDAKMEANGDSVRGKTVVKYTVEVNVDDISNGFETKLVINIPK